MTQQSSDGRPQVTISVLLVEDDAPTRWRLHDALAAAQFEVTSAATLAEARAALANPERPVPKVLLTDLQLPDGHGTELIREVRIMRHLGEALDQVRNAEYARLCGKDRRSIKGQKYNLLSCHENLTLEGKRSLKILLAANRRLNTAYVLKEALASSGITSAKVGRGASSKIGAPASNGSASDPTSASPT